MSWINTRPIKLYHPMLNTGLQVSSRQSIRIKSPMILLLRDNSSDYKMNNTKLQQAWLIHYSNCNKSVDIVYSLCYEASSAWRGFASEADRNRLETFRRWEVRLEYPDTTVRSPSEICELVDLMLSIRIPYTLPDMYFIHSFHRSTVKRILYTAVVSPFPTDNLN